MSLVDRLKGRLESREDAHDDGFERLERRVVFNVDIEGFTQDPCSHEGDEGYGKESMTGMSGEGTDEGAGGPPPELHRLPSDIASEIPESVVGAQGRASAET